MGGGDFVWRGMRKKGPKGGREKPEPIFDNIKHGNLPETSGANRRGERGGENALNGPCEQRD